LPQNPHNERSKGVRAGMVRTEGAKTPFRGTRIAVRAKSRDGGSGDLPKLNGDCVRMRKKKSSHRMTSRKGHENRGGKKRLGRDLSHQVGLLSIYLKNRSGARTTAYKKGIDRRDGGGFPRAHRRDLTITGGTETNQLQKARKRRETV